VVPATAPPSKVYLPVILAWWWTVFRGLNDFGRLEKQPLSASAQVRLNFISAGRWYNHRKPGCGECEMATVLIVDDDPKLLTMLRRTLAYEGFRVLSATNGTEALGEVQAHRPDVVVLDWLMPGLDGIGVLEHLRAAGDKTLVLMLTARDAVENRVEGLETGADDYLVKPFAPAELLARIHALLRRPAVLARDESLNYAGLRLDPVTRETWRGVRAFNLTAKEYDLLYYLLRNPRQVLRREQILQEVWGYDFGGEDNVLEVYIGYLRKKTEAGGEPRLIQTVRGVGYVLREE
jgi:two-component system response regulator MprA